MAGRGINRDQDAETGAQTVIDAGDSRWRKAFAAQAASRDAGASGDTRQGRSCSCCPRRKAIVGVGAFHAGRKR